MSTAILRDDHHPLPGGPRNAFHRPAIAIAFARDTAPPARADLCRLTAAIFGLAVYLGLPLGGLLYLGLEIGKTIATF